MLGNIFEGIRRIHICQGRHASDLANIGTGPAILLGVYLHKRAKSLWAVLSTHPCWTAAVRVARISGFAAYDLPTRVKYTKVFCMNTISVSLLEETINRCPNKLGQESNASYSGACKMCLVEILSEHDRSFVFPSRNHWRAPGMLLTSSCFSG